MKIKKFIINPFQINCFIYYDDNSFEGVIIDPAAYEKYEEDNILKFIKEKNIKIKYIINTHGHVDHVLGNSFAKKNFNCPLLIHKDDLFLLNNSHTQGLFYGMDVTTSPEPDEFINDNLIVKTGETEIMFIHMPGHSPGGVCVTDHINKNVFCGDTIFSGTIGRTDLPGGDLNTLIDSIKTKLFLQCDDDYILYPGHMEKTTVGNEKIFNPFLK